MTHNQALLNELKNEAESTRKILSRVPDDKLDWKPHAKSMSIGRLSTHVAELLGWVAMALQTDELDFAKRAYKPNVATNNKELLATFEENYNKAVTALENVQEGDFAKIWTLRNGDHTIFQLPKAAVVRSFAVNHMIHHRGQLSVYLRLNDVPVPGMYGPSADDGAM